MHKRCEKCNILKDSSNFYAREDRKGFYAWCIECMVKDCREPDWPGYRQRGGGNLELEPRD